MSRPAIPPTPSPFQEEGRDAGDTHAPPNEPTGSLFQGEGWVGGGARPPGLTPTLALPLAGGGKCSAGGLCVSRATEQSAA
jgi:hypothetical protein